MDCTQMLQRVGRGGLCTAAAAAATLAGPGVAAAQSHRTYSGDNESYYYYYEARRNDQARYSDPRAYELQHPQSDTVSYGDVNYGEWPPYGDFSYYGGEDDRAAAAPPPQPVVRQQPVIQETTIREDQTWQAASSDELRRQEMPRTYVQIYDYRVEEGRGTGGMAQQPVRYQDTSLRQEQVQPRAPVQKDTGRDWVSYGDVNFEKDPGFGEFSYYGDDDQSLPRSGGQTGGQTVIPASQRLGGSGTSAPNQPAVYYTEDWHEDQTEIDEVLEKDR